MALFPGCQDQCQENNVHIFHHIVDCSFVSSPQSVFVCVDTLYSLAAVATDPDRQTLMDQAEVAQHVECDFCRPPPNNAEGDAEDHGISWMKIVAIMVEVECGETCVCRDFGKRRL